MSIELQNEDETPALPSCGNFEEVAKFIHGLRFISDEGKDEFKHYLATRLSRIESPRDFLVKVQGLLAISKSGLVFNVNIVSGGKIMFEACISNPEDAEVRNLINSGLSLSPRSLIGENSAPLNSGRNSTYGIIDDLSSPRYRDRFIGDRVDKVFEGFTISDGLMPAHRSPDHDQPLYLNLVI